MKTTKIIFWITTGLIFLFEGVMPALTGNSEMAKQGISHLGYPSYFGIYLAVWKVLGSLSIIIPMVPARIKEWAYFGLGVTMISAFASHWATDGFSGQAIMPVVVLGVLSVSYIYYHKLNSEKA